MPTGRPIMKTPSARARRAGGNRSPISDVAAGAQVASPTPTPSRTTKSCQKLRAIPETAVRALHTKTPTARMRVRSEEYTSELQSLRHLVCRLLLEKKKKKKTT